MLRWRVASVLPKTREAEKPSAFHADEVGLLRFRVLAPLVEAVGRDEAAAPVEGVAEGRLLGEALCSGVDELRADGGILGPVRDEAPADGVEGPLACFGVA